MFHDSTMNNRINKIHEKTLRFFCKDEINLSYDGLLKSKYSPKKFTSLSDRNLYGEKRSKAWNYERSLYHFVQKLYNLRNDSVL